MSDTTTVWVTEVYLGCDRPKIIRYEASEIRKEGILISNFTVAGNPVPTGSFLKHRAQVIRGASGRRFFTNYAELLAFCHAYMLRQIEQHRSVANDLEEDLQKHDLGIEITPHGSAVRRSAAR